MARYSWHKRVSWTAMAAAAVLTAACGTFRWAGHHRHPDLGPSPRLQASNVEPDFSRELEIAVTTVAPGGFTARELKALYYYDLGPERIDVSGYPERQRDNHEVFARVCSRCHTLARGLNSPRDNRLLWEYYVLRMRLYGAIDRETSFTREEADRILEFLAYDSKERKAHRRVEFEELQRRLKERFDRILRERMRRLQEQPPLRR